MTMLLGIWRSLFVDIVKRGLRLEAGGRLLLEGGGALLPEND